MDYELYIIVLCLQYHVTSSGDGWFASCLSYFAYCRVAACLFVVVSLLAAKQLLVTTSSTGELHQPNSRYFGS